MALGSGGAICPVFGVGGSGGAWRIDGFGALFCWGYGLSGGGNWIVVFFKGRITLKDFKIIRLSEPTVCFK